MLRTGCQSWLVLLLLQFAVTSFAGPEFPKLTGRIVDNADLLSVAVTKKLNRMLKEHEQQTTNQLVVVTLPGLQGYTIKKYGYQLGRHWGIGQKSKNNGVLLIVVPNERKVRIEVGYGLEGLLTDALCHDIIKNFILPDFRQGKYAEGILAGTKNILSVINGINKKRVKKSSAKGPAKRAISIVNIPDRSETIETLGYVLIVLTVGAIVGAIILFIVIILISIYNERGGGHLGDYSSGDSDGGFSGGGGSFGGGGATGDW